MRKTYPISRDFEASGCTEDGVPIFNYPGEGSIVGIGCTTEARGWKSVRIVWVHPYEVLSVTPPVIRVHYRVEELT